jgi:hypothetical protein
VKALDLVLWHQSRYWCFQLGLCQCPYLFSRLMCWAVWGRMLFLFVRLLSGESARGFLNLLFLSLMGHLVQVGSLTWSHQKVGLWTVIGSFCPQAGCNWGLWLLTIRLSKVVRYACFHQGSAELLHSLNSGWSALPSARWGNSVLCAIHSPTR